LVFQLEKLLFLMMGIHQCVYHSIWIKK